MNSLSDLLSSLSVPAVQSANNMKCLLKSIKLEVRTLDKQLFNHILEHFRDIQRNLATKVTLKNDYQQKGKTFVSIDCLRRDGKWVSVYEIDMTKLKAMHHIIWSLLAAAAVDAFWSVNTKIAYLPKIEDKEHTKLIPAGGTVVIAKLTQYRKSWWYRKNHVI